MLLPVRLRLQKRKCLPEMRQQNESIIQPIILMKIMSGNAQPVSTLLKKQPTFSGKQDNKTGTGANLTLSWWNKKSMDFYPHFIIQCTIFIRRETQSCQNTVWIVLWYFVPVYPSPDGSQIEIDLKLKRTYEIEDGKLLDFFDTEVVANDELLTKYLAKNKQAVLGEIIATIQKEQNDSSWKMILPKYGLASAFSLRKRARFICSCSVTVLFKMVRTSVYHILKI